MGGALLMAYQHVLDLVLLEQLIVDVQDRAAGVAEDVSHAFFLQTAHEDFGAGDRTIGGSQPRGTGRIGTQGLGGEAGRQRGGCLIWGKGSHVILSRSFWRLIGRRSVSARDGWCGEAEPETIAQRLQLRKFPRRRRAGGRPGRGGTDRL